MSLSDQNQAIVGRDREVYTISAADLDRYLDAARAEGPEPQTIPLGAKQAAIEALEPFAIALEHFKDPRPYLLLESFHRAAEALAMLRAEGRPSPEEVLADQNAVHINMLRGGIAKPSPAQIGHLYRGDEAAEVVREVIRQNPEAALSTPSPERAEGATAGEVKGNLPADPASVLPVLAHLVATGEATAKQRAELPPPPAGEVKEALNMTGLRTIAEVIDMANVGQSLMENITLLKKAKAPFKDWTPADDPAEIVFDLVNHYEDAAALSPPAPEPDLFAGNAKKPEPGYEAEPVGDWIMVPREPTEGILRAGFGNHYRLDTALGRERAADDYRAMFCALPAHDPVAELVAWRRRPIDSDRPWTLFDSPDDLTYYAGNGRYVVQALYASPVPVAISREEIIGLITDRVGAFFPEDRDMWLTDVGNAADAILQRLSNQQGEGKGSIPELPGVSAVQQPASSTAQHFSGEANLSDGSGA